MFSTYLNRTALAIAAIVAVLAVPTVALGGSLKATAPPDQFERYATAHPYGVGVAPMPDWFERYAANHSPATIADGRSPDTLDAAAVAGLQLVDGRSPDTLDAAQTIQPVEIVSPTGFDWSDAGIGAGLGAGALALLGALGVALMSNRRQRVRAA